MPRWAWFALFNAGTTIYMIVSGELEWDFTSIGSYVVVLLLINLIIWRAARRYKGWK
jgi:hypothetical protein